MYQSAHSGRPSITYWPLTAPVPRGEFWRASKLRHRHCPWQAGHVRVVACHLIRNGDQQVDVAPVIKIAPAQGSHECCSRHAVVPLEPVEGLAELCIAE
jgi:hypothetical protein